MHALLSNIELRTMNEENKPGAVMEIVERGMELEKQRIEEENLLIERTKLVTMTNITTNEGRKVESETSIARWDSQLSNNLELPMGSFLSIDSEQSSKKEEDAHVTSMTNRVKILKFEDTLADKDYRQFRVIYNSLLLEGKVGNLTKSTLEVVLAQKPPAWWQIIYEKLKHLIISSETFWDKKKKHMAKERVKLSKKIRFKANKGQRRWKVGNSSNHWLKDHLNKTIV